MRSGQTLEFDVRKMGLYDDTNLTAYRTPPTPQTIVNNVGDVGVEKVSKAPNLKLGNFR